MSTFLSNFSLQSRHFVVVPPLFGRREVRDKTHTKKMSVLDRFPHSTAELKRVKTVQFGVLSPDEIVSVFFSLLFPSHARFAKSRVLRVCASRVIAADKISPSFFLSFTFSLLVLRREEAGKTRERDREGTNPSAGFVVFASETRTERSLFLSLSLHLNSPHPLSLSLFFSNY